MRKTKEILRLKSETDLTNRQIARSLNVSPTTVAECLKRAREAGLVWPFDICASDMDEGQLEALLYPEEHEPDRPLPDMRLCAGPRHQALGLPGNTPLPRGASCCLALVPWSDANTSVDNTAISVLRRASRRILMMSEHLFS